MNKAPAVGTRVAFAGNSTIPACVGVVMCVYPSEHVTWPDGDEGDPVPTGRYEPECEWKVAVKPDTLPAKWPYPGADMFSAKVADLTTIELKPRRPLDVGFAKGYLESDIDYVMNNLELAVRLLDQQGQQ